MSKPITAADRVTVVTRQTLPTASFSLTVPQIRWIAEEAQRRKVSKSEVVRDALTDAMQDEAEAA